MKKRAPILLCALVFLLGFAVMFYPTVSNWVHEQTASYAISDYLDRVSAKDADESAAMFAQASAYNATLTGDVQSFMIAEENEQNNVQDATYWDTFDDLNSMIGVIEIPTIGVSLPIYHGTDESVLQKGVGHLEGSALPTGEIGNHTVLTGHTGLPSAMLFTDLDKLVLGDTFSLQVLDKIFTYEVCDINVVLPSDTSVLQTQSEQDLVTLVTCTPYGVNSHRLLVTGTQIAVSDVQSQLVVDQVTTDSGSALDSLPILVAIAVMLLVIFAGVAIFVLVSGRYRPKH